MYRHEVKFKLVLSATQVPGLMTGSGPTEAGGSAQAQAPGTVPSSREVADTVSSPSFWHKNIVFLTYSSA